MNNLSKTLLALNASMQGVGGMDYIGVNNKAPIQPKPMHSVKKSKYIVKTNNK